jgi:uncharacterized protein involved in exopolysaccharide biosynthesis
MSMASFTENVHLREYLRIVRKQKWRIAACFVVAVGAVGLATYLQQPVYRASTKALIERDVGRVVNFGNVPAPVGEERDFIQTQLQIIRSRPVIQRAIETLGLVGRRPELAKVRDPVNAVTAAITVEPVRSSRLVEIRVEDTDPKMAAEIANGVANAYVHQDLDMKLAAAREALSWLTAQVSDLKSKVNDSELTLQRYREQAGLVSGEEKEGVTARKLVEYNAQYIDAKGRRLEMETRLAEFRRAAERPELVESSPIVINNPVIQRLKGQLVDLEVQRSKLLKTYKEKHPEVVKVDSQIAEFHQKVREETLRITQSMESEYNVLKAREAALVTALNQQRGEAQVLAKKEIQYGILKRDADSNQQLYEVLLKRLKETSLAQGLDSNSIRIVEPALVPTNPVRPRPLLNLAVAAAVGLVIGFALAFFLEYMDDTVRTPEQVERTLGVPVFALIPVIPPTGSRS